MSGISTHILDTSRGCPAPFVEVTLERWSAGAWHEVARLPTDLDGRIRPLLAAEKVEAGTYRLTFAVGAYFAALGTTTLFPEIAVTFAVAEGDRSYHIPLLLTAHSYTTYRGT